MFLKIIVVKCKKHVRMQCGRRVCIHAFGPDIFLNPGKKKKTEAFLFRT